MMIEDFGASIASVWQGLRSTTRNLIVGAMQSPVAPPVSRRSASAPYDARADWELSRLLSAFDERATEPDSSLTREQLKELRRMADTTADVLQFQTRSAEVFTQLVSRAHARNDFAKIDALADALTDRFAASEIAELTRGADPVVRALALEAMVQMPTGLLVALLADPIDAEIARDSIERQASEYESEEARHVLNALDQADTDDGEM